ncbi:MAG: flagellar biosynthetic protein FliR [Nitrospirae bacterium]|nr:flagellar biosynthetic protein FliR [Nitrospirota bacterium]
MDGKYLNYLYSELDTEYASVYTMKNAQIINDMGALSQYMTNFLFILLRASVFFSMLPVLGSKSLPAQFRMGMVVFISLVLTPVVNFAIKEDNLSLLILKEILLAVVLGLSAKLIFMAVNMAGQFISNAMGLSIATVFNPEMGQSTSVAEVYGIMAMLLFLAVDAHHELIYVFVKSYEVIPAGQLNINLLTPEVTAMGSRFLMLAFKLSAPVVVGLLLANLLSGFLYKAAPQMNIFFIIWPINLFLGFLLITLSIPAFSYVLNINFDEIKVEMMRIMSLAKG